MKIGIDIDGVILDSERNLRFWADYYSWFELGIDKKTFELVSQEDSFDWTKEDVDGFYETRFDKICRNSSLMVGAKEILSKLKEEGNELYVITLRGYYREQERIDGEAKLKELGVEFDGVYWSVLDKVAKCKELGIKVMIDDNPKNVAQFEGSEISVLYFREPKIKRFDFDNVYEVDSWMDAYRNIKKIGN